jgi:ribosomal protein L37E
MTMVLMECSECGKQMSSASATNCAHCGAITRQESTRSVEEQRNWKHTLSVFCGAAWFYAWLCAFLNNGEPRTQMRYFFLGVAFLVARVMLDLPKIYSYVKDQRVSTSKKWFTGMVVLAWWTLMVSFFIPFLPLNTWSTFYLLLGFTLVYSFKDIDLPSNARELVEDWRQTAKLHRESKWRRVIFVIVVVVGISLCICLYVYNLLNPFP